MTTPRQEPRRHRPLRPYLAAAAAVALALGLLATAGVKSYRDLEGALEHERSLERQIAAAEQRIRVLDRRAELIARDPATLERLAREELGMVRPGDVVIVLPAGDDAAAVADDDPVTPAPE